MNTFEFQGPETNLGRFGVVTKGTVLILTEVEAKCIKGDKRFKPVDADVKKADQEKVVRLEIDQMDHTQLVEYCEAIRQVDSSFQFRPDMDHKRLLQVVRERLATQSPTQP